MQFDYSFPEQNEICSPQLVLYQNAMQDNIDQMIRIAGAPDRLWPHVKTHKMLNAVKLQTAAGIRHFKCATVAEAEMCGMAGADAVILAYPLIGPSIRRFLRLTQTFPHTVFYAVGDNTEAVKAAAQAAAAENLVIQMLMDIDLGQNRTGVVPASAAELYPVWSRMEGIHMAGLHCYDGHRHESDPQKRFAMVQEEDFAVSQILSRLKDARQDCGVVVLGGTPSFPCHVRLMPGCGYSPGTCVLWDHGYERSYPDLQFTPAAAILTRVISVRGNGLMTLDMGTKSVASDPRPERASIAGFEDAVTVLQNEEHWLVRIPERPGRRIPPVGTVLFAIPTHVCPTCALYPSVPVVKNGRLAGFWDVTARNRSITI